MNCHIIVVKKMAGSKMRLCELREKEVINICDGEKLGRSEEHTSELQSQR